MMARTLSQTSGPASPGRMRRPMTSAEIMRQQMRVTDQSDARLRRTLMRTVVGQVGAHGGIDRFRLHLFLDKSGLHTGGRRRLFSRWNSYGS